MRQLGSSTMRPAVYTSRFQTATPSLSSQAGGRATRFSSALMRALRSSLWRMVRFSLRFGVSASRTSAYFGRQHFFQKYMYLYAGLLPRRHQSFVFPGVPGPSCVHGHMPCGIFKVTVVSDTDRAVTGGAERGTASRETQSQNRAVSSCFPSVKTSSGAAEPSSRQESERDTGHDCSCSEQDSRESRRGGFDSVLPEQEYCFPGRAAMPSGKQLTHRSEDRMSVSGLCTRVPGTVRVWCAAADTPQSTQTVSCGSRQGLTRDRGPE